MGVLFNSLLEASYSIEKLVPTWAMRVECLYTDSEQTFPIKTRIQFGIDAPPPSKCSESVGPIRFTMDLLNPDSAAKVLSELDGLSKSTQSKSQRVNAQNWQIEGPGKSWPNHREIPLCYLARQSLFHTKEEQDLLRIIKNTTPTILQPSEMGFVNLSSAIKEWFRFDECRLDPRSDSRDFEIIFPLMHGQVSRLEESKVGALQAHVTLWHEDANITARLAFEDNGKAVSIDRPVENGIATFPTCPSSNFAVFTISSGQLLHYYQDRHYSIHRPSIDPSKEELEPLLLNGESDRVEFKEITFPNNSDKRDFILREIVAIANKQGGAVLLGVNDDGHPCGIRWSKDHKETKTPDIRREELTQFIRLGLTQKCQNIPDISFDWYSLEGRDVLMVRISSSMPSLPSTLNDEVLVRSGATSRRATIEEVRLLLS